MSIKEQVKALEDNISSAYDAIVAKGGMATGNKNTANLAESIASIKGGGGGSVTNGHTAKFYAKTGTVPTNTFVNIKYSSDGLSVVNSDGSGANAFAGASSCVLTDGRIFSLLCSGTSSSAAFFPLVHTIDAEGHSTCIQGNSSYQSICRPLVFALDSNKVLVFTRTGRYNSPAATIVGRVLQVGDDGTITQLNSQNLWANATTGTDTRQVWDLTGCILPNGQFAIVSSMTTANYEVSMAIVEVIDNAITVVIKKQISAGFSGGDRPMGVAMAYYKEGIVCLCITNDAYSKSQQIFMLNTQQLDGTTWTPISTLVVPNAGDEAMSKPVIVVAGAYIGLIHHLEYVYQSGKLYYSIFSVSDSYVLTMKEQKLLYDPSGLEYVTDTCYFCFSCDSFTTPTWSFVTYPQIMDASGQYHMKSALGMFWLIDNEDGTYTVRNDSIGGTSVGGAFTTIAQTQGYYCVLNGGATLAGASGINTKYSNIQMTTFQSSGKDLAIPASKTIDGLTADDITTTQPGSVWLLGGGA